MGWRTVVVTQHAKLTYSQNMLVFQNARTLQQIPVDDIEMLVIATTQAVITSHLISELTRRGAKVIFTDTKHEPVCETVSYYPGDLSLSKIKEQFNWESSGRATKLWTQIILSKIANQIQVLELTEHDASEMKQQLQLVQASDKTNREAVAARIYFNQLFEKQFTRRDDFYFNSALDYGYAIILSKFNQEIVRNGYFTFLGIHHHSEENQFNLGCDLMEPFRPVVDYWLSNQKFNDFTPDVRLGLIDLLNLEISYNGKKTLVSNAIKTYVRDCLMFLNGEKENILIEVKLPNEVSYNEINGHV